MTRTFNQITVMPERWAHALRLRARGTTYAAIGARLGVSLERARQIVQKAERRARNMRHAKSGLLALVSVTALFAASSARADPCKAIPDHGPLPAYLAPGSVFSGPVTYVGDGDSLCVGLGPSPDQWVEVRLADFYAPELHDAGGEAAKATLMRIALGRPITCRADHQSYDRVVAWCTLSGRSVGDQMRRAGVAEGGHGTR